MSRLASSVTRIKRYLPLSLKKIACGDGAAIDQDF